MYNSFLNTPKEQIIINKTQRKEIKELFAIKLKQEFPNSTINYKRSGWELVVDNFNFEIRPRYFTLTGSSSVNNHDQLMAIFDMLDNMIEECIAEVVE